MNHWLGIFGLDAESITRTVNQVKQVASTEVADFRGDVFENIPPTGEARRWP